MSWYWVSLAISQTAAATQAWEKAEDMTADWVVYTPDGEIKIGRKIKMKIRVVYVAQDEIGQMKCLAP